LTTYHEECVSQAFKCARLVFCLASTTVNLLQDANIYVAECDSGGEASLKLEAGRQVD
jgi:hypothetical protein